MRALLCEIDLRVGRERTIYALGAQTWAESLVSENSHDELYLLGHCGDIFENEGILVIFS